MGFVRAAEVKFGGAARVKNMFCFDETRAAAQLHYRTLMLNFVYPPEGQSTKAHALTYGELAMRPQTREL